MFMRIMRLPACVSNMCMRKLFYEKDSFVLGKKMQKLCGNTKGLIYGGKINDNMTIVNSNLEICGIETIADLEMSFHIFDSESWETYLDTELVQINTSAQEGYAYEYDDTTEQVNGTKGTMMLLGA